MHLQELLLDRTVRAQVSATVDNSAFTEEYQPLRAPVDADGYVQVVSGDDKAGIRTFFDRYGFVCVPVLELPECDATVTEIWDFIERHSPDVVRSDPTTWEAFPMLREVGMLGSTPVLSPQFFANRVNPRVVEAMSSVLGKAPDEIYVNCARAGLMRPTQVDIGGQPTAKPDWTTKDHRDWMHFDAEPSTGGQTTYSWRVKDLVLNKDYDRLSLQGVINLVDNKDGDGGFICVPGSHRHVRSWANAHPEPESGSRNKVGSSQLRLSPDDPLVSSAQHITARPGTMILWSSWTVHANTAKKPGSTRPRAVQYIRAIPRNDPVVGPFDMSDLLPTSEELTLSRKERALLGCHD